MPCRKWEMEVSDFGNSDHQVALVRQWPTQRPKDMRVRGQPLVARRQAGMHARRHTEHAGCVPQRRHVLAR